MHCDDRWAQKFLRMGCQKAITEAITDADVDYVLALKDS
jgi:predicted transposase YbfD/YdcC